MNDDELRQRLMESVGEGSTNFWSSVDQALERVEATDGFVTAIAEDDPTQPLAPVAPIGRGARSFRVALAAAAVLILGAGGLAAGLLNRSTDSVTTNQPAAQSERTDQDETSLSTPIDLLPAGTELCYADARDGSASTARAELLDGSALAGYVVSPTEAVPLAIVDRFVGRRTAGDALNVTVNRFNEGERSRRNANWTIGDAELTTEDTTLRRIDCDELATVPGAAGVDKTDAESQLIRTLAAEAESGERVLNLRPLGETGETELGLNGVDVRAGETVVFRFDAEAGTVLSYEVAASSPPTAVVLVGPAMLALETGPVVSEVRVPHPGTHHLVVSADVGMALSITVSN